MKHIYKTFLVDLCIFCIIITYILAYAKVGIRQTLSVTRQNHRASAAPLLNSLHNTGTSNTQYEKCILVSVEKLSHSESLVSPLTFEESLKEMTELCKTTGLTVVGSCTQKLERAHPNSYLGSGKLEELKNMCRLLGVSVVVVDDDITPRQQRGIEMKLKPYSRQSTLTNKEIQSNSILSNQEEITIKVLDRSAIILDIFAQHAKSREGQLQVELAMLQYHRTRDNTYNNLGNHQNNNGNAGLRGPGESKLELNKRKILKRIEILEKEIIQLRQQRETQYKERIYNKTPIVALVGYTNAGKSSVLNQLARSNVLSENKLFATLDPTTRKLRLPFKNAHDIKDINTSDTTTATTTPTPSAGMSILLTDTVGFISKLPSQLISAFHSTLECIRHADAIVHVCDRSNPLWEQQRAVIHRELDTLLQHTDTNIPIIEFWNKMDLVDIEERIKIIKEINNYPIEMEIITNTNHTDYTNSSNISSDYSDGLNNTSVKNNNTSIDANNDYIDPELDAISCLPDSTYDRPAKRPSRPTTVATVGKKKPKQTRKSQRERIGFPHTLPRSIEEQQQQREEDETQDELSSGMLYMQPVHRVGRPTTAAFTAIGSAVDTESRSRDSGSRSNDSSSGSLSTIGMGLQDLVLKLETALSLDYLSQEYYIPYPAAILPRILESCVVHHLRYTETGVYLSGKIPPHMTALLRNFQV